MMTITARSLVEAKAIESVRNDEKWQTVIL
jgi:hypothetical protein